MEADSQFQLLFKDISRHAQSWLFHFSIYTAQCDRKICQGKVEQRKRGMEIVLLAMQWVCSFIRPFHYFLSLLYGMHCLYNFKIDLSKDNNLFWSCPGLCCCPADLRTYLQVHVIKKLEKQKGHLKALRFSLGQVSGHSAVGGKSGAIAVLQEP